MLQKQIEARLATYRDVYLQQELGKVNAVKRVSVSGKTITIEVVLGYPLASYKEELKARLIEWLKPVEGDAAFEIDISSQIYAHSGNPTVPALPGIKNIIAVGSGKGGVGKSTVSVNLALALAREGAAVGLLDADIYGPSQPLMLGTTQTRPEVNGRILTPISKHGIQSISMGNLVAETAALAWRGPMLGKALQQLINDTQWGELDYLVIDLPPGTGDVQLTMCQKIPVAGAVIVTTPQDMSLADVRRACEMFKKLSVPILGVVENMSMYRCRHCGAEEHLFGEGGAAKIAQEYEVQMLGAIPLDIEIREQTDNGNPPVTPFLSVARATAAKLALQKKDYSSKLATIKVVHN